MWPEALTTVGLGVASAIVPVINIEALIVVAAAQDRAPTWLLVTAATIGQMAGKLLWYYGGRELERFPFVARRMRKPKASATMEKWRARTEGRPWFMAGLLLVSAAAGLPPYAILAVVAGALRVRLSVFLITGLIGRALRFWAVISGTAAVISWW
ncbi:MAG: VTT domain-containing protein [Knoellia sp.]